jgi:hypothetical protein
MQFGFVFELKKKKKIESKFLPRHKTSNEL